MSTMLRLIGGLGVVVACSACGAVQVGPAEDVLASNGMRLVSVQVFEGSRPRFTSDGIAEAPSVVERFPRGDWAASSADRPGDALDASVIETRGGVTAYLTDWETMKLTDGQTEVLFDFPRGTAGRLNADGSFWTKTVGDGTNQWTRHTLSGGAEPIGDLGEVVFFDARGDTLLLGHKDASGRRVVEVVVR